MDDVAPVDDLAVLDRFLDRARLLGVEVDVRWRVAALTFDLHPGGGGDARVQLLLSPVGHVAALLRRRTHGRLEVARLTPETLLAAVARCGEPVVAAPLVDVPEPAWEAPPGMVGESSALDGRAHSLTLSVSCPEGWDLDVRIGFDEARLRDAAGAAIRPG